MTPLGEIIETRIDHDRMTMQVRVNFDGPGPAVVSLRVTEEVLEALQSQIHQTFSQADDIPGPVCEVCGQRLVWDEYPTPRPPGEWIHPDPEEHKPMPVWA